jgi:hypothetical protein
MGLCPIHHSNWILNPPVTVQGLSLLTCGPWTTHWETQLCLRAAPKRHCFWIKEPGSTWHLLKNNCGPFHTVDCTHRTSFPTDSKEAPSQISESSFRILFLVCFYLTSISNRHFPYSYYSHYSNLFKIFYQSFLFFPLFVCGCRMSH